MKALGNVSGGEEGRWRIEDGAEGAQYARVFDNLKRDA